MATTSGQGLYQNTSDVVIVKFGLSIAQLIDVVR